MERDEKPFPGAVCEITAGEEGGPHVQEQERKWPEHVKPGLLGCRLQRWQEFAQLVCAAITLTSLPLESLGDCRYQGDVETLF